ncbi:MAG: hypothetical protein J5774_04685 [Clostridia bacterium]|nr:hypothetical protein [Clostridia bacterium]
MEESSMKSFLIRKFLDKDFNFFFGFFLGTILLSAIAMVAFSLIGAFMMDVETFREQFNNGYEIEVKSAKYLSELKGKDVLLFAEGGSGLTYNVTLSCGEKEKEVGFLNRGIVILNAPKAYGSICVGDVLLDADTAEELGCEIGDEITVGGRACRYVSTMNYYSYLPSRSSAFALYDQSVKPSSFSAVFFRMEDALAFSEKVDDPSEIEDNSGVLSYYKGMKFLRNVFIVFACFMAFICVLFYAVFLSIYLMRKSRFSEITRAFGGSKIDYSFSIASAFSIVSLLGTAFGLLLAAGLRRIINYWAGEIIGMELNPVSFVALFFGYLLGSFLAIGALSFIISWRVDRDGVVFC